MRLYTLGPRLAACADYVRPGSRLLDVGTDHGLLPVWLTVTGRIPSAIASDINELPLATARENIAEHGVEDKVTAVLCDGLSGIAPNSADDIVIAGMGGELIASIIKPVGWLRDPSLRLILQPMSRAERLRAFLFDEGFDIISEAAVTDAGRIYTVMRVEYRGVVRYTPADVWAGRLLNSPEKEAAALLRRELSAMRSEAEGCRHRGNINRAEELEGTIDEIEKRMEGAAQ